MLHKEILCCEPSQRVSAVFKTAEWEGLVDEACDSLNRQSNSVIAPNDYRVVHLTTEKAGGRHIDVSVLFINPGNEKPVIAMVGRLDEVAALEKVILSWGLTN